MSTKEVDQTVDDFAASAKLARRAGYDGVEIMGSEGYLVNQMLTARTNNRTDRWGGSAENRMRFPVEIVERVREAVGDDFIVMYRMSLLDLVDDAQSWDETAELARRIEAAGASIINTGIGWHEARIPTIVTSVPRAAFAWTTAKLKGVVDLPVVASNRINTPEIAEQILADGQADLISMARPFLADAEFVRKAEEGRADEINTCIACNQACLDHTFVNKRASCMVNPRACRETELVLLPTRTVKRVAVVGAGPAGLAAASELAHRGHQVELFEEQAEIGGQFRLAMHIPGKEEFRETLRYYTRRLELGGVKLHLGRRAVVEDLAGFDDVVIATGVEPRIPSLPGIDHPKVVDYQQVIRDRVPVGERVAVMGAGGIGFDVSEFLLHDVDESLEHWMERWGISDDEEDRGGLATKVKAPPRRQIHLLQRKTSSLGKGLGKTSGWVHRTTLKDSGVEMVPGVTYDKIDDDGLHITVRTKGATTSRACSTSTRSCCAPARSPCATSSSRSSRPGSPCTSSAAPTSPSSWTRSARSSRPPNSRLGSDGPRLRSGTVPGEGLNHVGHHRLSDRRTARRTDSLARSCRARTRWASWPRCCSASLARSSAGPSGPCSATTRSSTSRPAVSSCRSSAP